MLLASLLAFFLVIFLVATLTAAIAWLAFLKRQAEAQEAARNLVEPLDDAPEGGESLLFREERLSTVTFWK